ncbi:hypothetical protein C4580_02610 [Candidatus Woesearchaeota archaeon]|nr:MAG: hypothetical protein C4580_02610 [Candidatus Woesearchaeota archaeon]
MAKKKGKPAPLQTELFSPRSTYGVLPSQELRDSADKGAILLSEPLAEGQIQPSSIDLRLGDWAACVRGAFLPRKDEDIEKTIERQTLYRCDLAPHKTTLLTRHQTFVVPLLESTNLPEGFSGEINAKSSTGRSDTLTRVIASGVQRFDTITPGKRQLYMFITPQSWHVRVRKGTALGQLRLKYGDASYDEASLRLRDAQTPLLSNTAYERVPLTERIKRGRVSLNVDLDTNEIIAYKAKPSSQLEYDLSSGKGRHAGQWQKYFEAIERGEKEVTLENNEFYLLSTLESFHFPADLCGVLDAYDETVAEGRSHYAGFADPGFKRPITLEVRITGGSYTIAHGQPLALLRVERLRLAPLDEKGNPLVYGDAIKSHYSSQSGPTLGKQFQPADK